MSDETQQPDDTSKAEPPTGEVQLERGTYEIIQQRLHSHAEELRSRIGKLNEERREVFGSIPTELISTQRITTANNCVAQDIVPIGQQFVFGYNVHMGLKAVTELADVFGVYRFSDGSMHEQPLTLLEDAAFATDFASLYKYYRDTRFLRFHLAGPHLYLVFQVGKSFDDTKAFKFLVDGQRLKYIDNRSNHEIVLPPQHDFKWVRTHRDLHRDGVHPHVSIDDRVFVETVGGDLTIKVEDNTDDGTGVYEEPVDDPDQTLDDAEYFYSIVGNLVLLKIRPFKESDFRHLVFNEKTQSARRLDSIAQACVFLPEDHGLIFSNGYYLQTGVYKKFENDITGLMFERRIASSNGEDYLYVFYNPATGQKVLLSYNMIQQEVATPIVCSGFSIFDNGQLIYFRSDDAAQKHHAMQVWQTPYVGEDFQVGQQTESFVYKIGNKEIVRAMSECHEVLNLIGQDDSYTNLYIDLVRKSTDILDSYFWLNDPQTFELSTPLTAIRDSATAAVDEFDKVVRVRKSTTEQFATVSRSATDAVMTATSRHFEHIDDFVQSLADLRTIRGQVVSLKELKYVNLADVESLEEKVSDNARRLSERCVAFLLKEDSLLPYSQRVADQMAAIEALVTGVDAKKLDDDIAANAAQLEMLIEIVSNLKIDDANQRTRIIDNISAIFSSLNQTRATLKKKSQALLSVEGAAEFNSQLKLVSQAVVNYLDVSDSPERCDEYLTKMMVQVEELEGKFAEFDKFIVQLAEKREEIYAAFDSKKLQLVEARNKRATALMQAVDRIINGIRSKVAGFATIDAINSYFASDLMVDKVRDIVEQLDAMGESVKVDDVQSRLKTVREDAVRQLRDRNELYVDGQNVIQFGSHKFSVNTQPLDLTTVIKDGQMFFHLSGTNYFEAVAHEGLDATRDVWDQSVVSENRDVYRAEYLAYLMLLEFRSGEVEVVSKPADDEGDGLLKEVQSFMAARYAEGYIKGVHDHDASLILAPLLELDRDLGLLRYSTQARALATLFWCRRAVSDPQWHADWSSRLAALRAAREVMGEIADRTSYVSQLRAAIDEDVDLQHLATFADGTFSKEAADYLFDQHVSNQPLVCSGEAKAIADAFADFLDQRSATEKFQRLVTPSVADPAKDPAQHGSAANAASSANATSTMSVPARFLAVRQWIASFVSQHNFDHHAIDEVAAILIDGGFENRVASTVSPRHEITGMLGDHPRVDGKTMTLDYNEFMVRMSGFATTTVPAFESYLHLKKEVTDLRREELKLEEFKPRVLTSFVRNQLINDTYLPMVGANLARQIGVVGEDKRTDLMGLLLLVSPPGYGKTTLMEYIANRLGITFMKINGPAIGHQVTSLDPSEAPNASARGEIEKLNLALEMGDNVMIYVDDIQHCNPEFLQKFISLCDATRRIEGVFGGRTRTYDLRGRKVAVVMAGNPYTESGEKFQIPDMLASRADTYNLGDVIGDNADSFELSYLENSLTSNATLAPLNARSRKDVLAVIKMATSTDQPTQTIEGNYSIEEINEFVAVMKKLLAARDVILKVNREYIDSAAQADEYRVEPAFKLQGSYRDMNKIAQAIVPIMNDAELQTLIESHYLNQAQTLTSGAEANLLKLKEMTGKIDGESLARWTEIKRTFQRNLMLGAAGGEGQMAQVIAQMTGFSEGLHDIRKALDQGVQHLSGSQSPGAGESPAATEMSHAVSELSRFNQTLQEMKSLMASGDMMGANTVTPATQKIEVINKVPGVFLKLMRDQFRVMQTWVDPILRLSEVLPEAEGLIKTLRETQKSYERMLGQIDDESDSR